VSGWEMIPVVVLLAVILSWEVNEMYELARSVGQAGMEFKKANRQMTIFSKRGK
jgi:Sec-independent protein translocase protein TatA